MPVNVDIQMPDEFGHGIRLDNIEDGEIVYQRCVLITGRYISSFPHPVPDNESVLTITTTSTTGLPLFPTQHWPIARSYFKSLVFLTPGHNVLCLSIKPMGFGFHPNREEEPPLKLNLTYIPLLQTPPLHLALMVAKDSPLLIDCPPVKAGAISSAHSDLEAAIAKFRMTAYMWQALTAEDMRLKGLGRRSFRLEDEWAPDTVSKEFVTAATIGVLFKEGSASAAMRSTAKVHVVRSEKTVKELRDPDVAQQNEDGCNQNALHEYFVDALKAYGGPFEKEKRPIVAGLILDSHYDAERKLILGHAALGSHQDKGLSLGVIGSHLTYAWPRFVEEVVMCLTDVRAPGETVGNDNGECGTLWEACSIGQGAFLHEVGHAFGSPHRPGIMERGYAQHWPRNFLPFTAFCSANSTPGLEVVGPDTANNACWSLTDALLFRIFPHFRFPEDKLFPSEIYTSTPTTTVTYDAEQPDTIIFSSPAGIVQVKVQGNVLSEPSISKPVDTFALKVADLEKQYGRDACLAVHIVSSNGREKVYRNIWKLTTATSFIKVPGTNFVLRKQSYASAGMERGDHGREDMWHWATLLTKKGPDNKIIRAKRVDFQIGAIWDGGFVSFQDGEVVNLGPRVDKGIGSDHRFGGGRHNGEDLSNGAEIVKVVLRRGCWSDSELDSVKMYLDNGKSFGRLYWDDEDKREGEEFSLEPGPGQRIVGFCGQSGWGWGFSAIAEFGIITAPKDVDLPDEVYLMDELKNTNGGHPELDELLKDKKANK